MKFKNYFPIVFFFYVLLNTKVANAQTPDCLWAKALGSSSGWDYGCSMVVDGSGNVYTIGIFTGTVDFNPGPGLFNLTSSGIKDIFVSKLDSSGSFVWAKEIGGIGDESAASISLSQSGDIFISGTFQDTVDFDPDPLSSFILTSTVGGDGFILRLNSSGDFIWAKHIGGVDICLTLDSIDNIYISGSFNNTVDFDPDSGIFNLTSTGSYNDIYIAKLDDSGNFIWAKHVGGTSLDEAYFIKLDASGNIYITGFFGGSSDFNPDSTGVFYLHSGGYNVFISKFDNSGNFIWAKSMYGIEFSSGSSMTFDAEGNVFTVGYFEGTGDFDPDPLVVYNLIAPSSLDLLHHPANIFISKLDSSGNFMWAKNIGSHNADKAASIAIDPSGNIYTTGYFQGGVDFDPGVDTFFLNSSAERIFLSKLDNSGNFVWAKSIGGGTWNDVASSVVIDASGKIYITGNFNNPSLTIGSNSLINSDSTGYRCDVLIAKFDNSITGIDNINSSSNIFVYPNPATDNFTIDFGSNHINARTIISDLTGKIIYETLTSEKQKLEINTTNFSPGIYLVQIKSDDFIETKKIIIEN